MRPLLATLLLLPFALLRAELTTDHYRRLQDEAPECLVIRIDQVETQVTLGKDGRMTGVKATATIREVVRSKAGRKVGESLRIEYEVIQTVIPMPGPAPTPILEKGATVRAFLRPAGADTLGPAAYGQSFIKP